MLKCNLSKEINNCPFCNLDNMECKNKDTQCAFREKDIVKNQNNYERKERWYEKYYKK